jgi:hypothetical protein
MTDGQPGSRTGWVRFTGTADIERLLAGAPAVRAALLEEGVPATALSVTADAQLAVLRTGGRRYIRFATAGNGDPVAVELPSGRVVELVTRRHPPPETIVNVALYSTSAARFARSGKLFTPASRSTAARSSRHWKPPARLTGCAWTCSPTSNASTPAR